jgi:glycosyltransferase involved in cell wall biosynthesis
MRILYVVPSFGLGGMEKIICAVINNAANDHQHTIIPLNGCANALSLVTNTRIEVIPFQKAKRRELYFLSLYNTLRVIQPDLLMTYNWGATDAIWLGRLAGIRTIVHHEHGFNVDEGVSTARYRDFIRSIVYRLVSKIVVVSHEFEHVLRSRYRLPESHVSRIPNGVNTCFYSPNEEERQKMRKFLGYGESDFVIGFCGRLDPVKNLDLLLNVFQSTNPRHYPFRLLIVGDGPDGSRLQTRCQTSDLNGYVKFVGEQTEVFLIYVQWMYSF